MRWCRRQQGIAEELERTQICRPELITLTPGKIVGFAATDPLRDVAAIQYWPSVSTNCLALSGGATPPLRICSGVTGPP